jgi:HEPN domain-containing protein
MWRYLPRVSEVEAKVSKAKEFLSVADVAISANCLDAGVSSAVLAAINAADALCLELVGRFPSGGSHDEILGLLRRCGVTGDNVARHLRGLLKMKSRAQYSVRPSSQGEADRALQHAQRILGTVERLIKERQQR